MASPQQNSSSSTRAPQLSASSPIRALPLSASSPTRAPQLSVSSPTTAPQQSTPLPTMWSPLHCPLSLAMPHLQRASTPAVASSMEMLKPNPPTYPMLFTGEMATADLNTIVQLNVGGQHYETTLHTLIREADSELYDLVRDPEAHRDSQGRYFIDSDGELFRYILLFLQHDALPPLQYAEAVHKVAVDFGMEGLRQRLEERYPSIAIRTVQDQLMSFHMPEAIEHVQQIMQGALEVGNSPLKTLRPTLNPLHLYGSVRSDKGSDNPAVDPNHKCTMVWPHHLSGSHVSQPVDFMLGPNGIFFDPGEYVTHLCQYMKREGYSVQNYHLYPNASQATPCLICGGQLFCLALSWL